jgi:hypothetical protein
MPEQRTKPHQQQTCGNNQQTWHSDWNKQQRCHSYCNNQQTYHSYCNKQTTDMSLILQQTNNRHVTHTATNKQQTCRNKLDADQNDVSSQFHYVEPLSTFWVQTITHWMFHCCGIAYDHAEIDAAIWNAATTNRIGSTTDMPEQRIEPDQ